MLKYYGKCPTTNPPNLKNMVSFPGHFIQQAKYHFVYKQYEEGSNDHMKTCIFQKVPNRCLPKITTEVIQYIFGISP